MNIDKGLTDIFATEPPGLYPPDVADSPATGTYRSGAWGFDIYAG
jgi:hypothetical protein